MFDLSSNESWIDIRFTDEVSFAIHSAILEWGFQQLFLENDDRNRAIECY